MAAVRPDVPDGTHALLERIYRGQLGARLRSEMRRRHFSRSADEIADAWQEACAIAARACTGKREGEVFNYLRVTMHNLLVAAGQQPGLERGLDALATPADPQPAPEEQAGKQELATLARELLACLPARQQHVFLLHSHGLQKPIIAARLGATPRSVARDIETGFRRLRNSLVERVGGGCGGPEEGVVARYAFGLATRDQLPQAQRHLFDCAACQELYARLEAWREAAAAITPAPAAEQIDPGTLERVADRVGEGLSALKQHLTDGAATTKQHASGLWYRGVDPTPLSGARPGTAVAAIAGCLAIGGGAATYCVERGFNPINELGSLVDRQPAEQRPDPRPEKAEDQPAPAPPPSTTTPATPEPQPATPPPTAEATPPPVPPAPEDEYEPTTAGAQAATPPRAPAPARDGGIGEFQGP